MRRQNPTLLLAIGLCASLAQLATAAPSKQTTQVAGEGSEKGGNGAMDRINSESLEEDSVEPNQANAIDVILAGGGGSLKKGASKENNVAEPKPNNGLGGIGLNGGRQGQPRKISLHSLISAPKLSDLELEGDTLVRSKESILRVLRQHVGGFRYSHEKAMRNDIKVRGSLSLKFVIAPTGDVTEIVLANSTTTTLPSLDREILDKAKRMKFDRVEQGVVTATYSMVLEAE